MNRQDKIEKIYNLYEDSYKVFQLDQNQTAIFDTLLKIEKTIHVKKESYEAYYTDCEAYMLVDEEFLDFILKHGLKPSGQKVLLDKKYAQLESLNNYLEKANAKEKEFYKKKIAEKLLEIEKVQSKLTEYNIN